MAKYVEHIFVFLGYFVLLLRIFWMRTHTEIEGERKGETDRQTKKRENTEKHGQKAALGISLAEVENWRHTAMLYLSDLLGFLFIKFAYGLCLIQPHIEGRCVVSLIQISAVGHFSCLSSRSGVRVRKLGSYECHTNQKLEKSI